MNKILSDIKSTINGLKGAKTTPTPSSGSVTWFSKKLQSLKNITKGKLSPQNTNFKKEIINASKATKMFKYKKSGYVYFFNYIPPNTKKEEFYDEFPLVLSLGFSKNGMMGINLHYLPIKIRLLLVYKIVKSMSNNPKEGNRIKVASLFSSRTIRKYIMVLGEEYNFRGIRSKIKLVTPDEFLTMSFLPVQKFKKKQQGQIDQKIRKMLRGLK